MSLNLYKRETDRARSWETGVPAAGFDNGMAEAFWAAFEEMRHVENIDANRRNRHEYVQSALDKVRDATGETIRNPYDFYGGVEYTRYDGDESPEKVPVFARSMQKMRSRIDELRKSRPDLGLTDLSAEDITAGSEAIGRKYFEAEQASAFGRQNGTYLSGFAAFAGKAIGGLSDPLNMASMLAGGGPAKTVLGATARGAAVNMASQAAVTSLAYDYRRKIDPDYTYQSAVDEVLAAGVAGGILEGAGSAIAKGFGLMGKTRRLKDAEAIVSRETFLRQEKPPGTPQTASGVVAHQTAARTVVEQIQASLPINPPPTPAPGRMGRVIDASGRELDVQYELREARELITSHSDDLVPDPRFPQNLQPRDRSRAASQEQINKIAAELRPEWLGPSPRSDAGAPVIGSDGIVESGNGRVLALRRAYQRDGQQIADYRQFLQDQGFDPDQLKEPVLVARRVTDLSQADREKFVHASNTSTVARMSQGEQALADARLLTPELLDTLDRTGTPYSAEFARAVFKGLPQEERANLVDAYGVLSNDGIRRIQGMMLGRAYGDPAFLGRALEDADSNIKAIAGALTDAAPQWALLRDGVATGRVEPAMDVTADLLDAVRMVMKARDEGIKLPDLMNQAEMFGGPSGFAKIMARNFFNNGDMTRQASKARIGQFLKEFATEARKAEAGPRLLGDALKPEDVLATALGKADRQDLLPLIEARTTPEAAEKMAVSKAAEIDDQIIMEAQRMMAENGNLTVMVPDGKGGEEAKNLLDAFEELDAEIKAAQTIDACVTGKPIAETAE